MTYAVVAAAVDAGDVEACIVALEAMTPVERRAIATQAKALCASMRKQWRASSFDDSRRFSASIVAMTTTSVPSELGALLHLPVPDEIADALARTRPDWVEEAAEARVAVAPEYHGVARALVRRGVSKTPTHDGYIIGLLGTDTRGETHPFDDDPELLKYEAWRMFEVEGAGAASLAAADKYSGNSWSEAFLRHMHAATLDRARLIDATLDALDRDFAAFRAGWYSRFHTALEPTPAELSSRRDRYLRLLHSSIPATVSMALEVVTAIDSLEPIGADVLQSAVAPILLSRHKGTAIGGIKLLARAGARDSHGAACVTATLADGLSHDATDVQKAALDALDSLKEACSDETRAIVRDRAGGVAASLKTRVAKWLGSPVATPVPAPSPRAPTLGIVVTAPKASAAESGIRAIDSVDELVRVFSAVIEDDGDPDECERVLAGLAKIGRLDSSGAKLANALANRARKIRKDPLEKDLLMSMVALARAWTAPAGEAYATLEQAEVLAAARERYADELHATFLKRVELLTRQLDANVREPLLSAPTHRGGFIEPAVAVERFAAWVAAKQGGKLLELRTTDVALALLRLAPHARDRALAELARVGAKHEALDALAYALGGKQPKIGKTAAWWAAAARARSPLESDAAVEKAHPGLGPDAATAATFTWRVTSRRSDGYTFYDLRVTVSPKFPAKSASVALVAVQRLRNDAHVGKSFRRWSFTAWPTGTESFFGGALQQVGDNLDWHEAQWDDIAIFEALRAPSLEFGPMARAVLTLGLGAKEPGQSGVSVDAAISAIATARLTGAALGETLREFRATGMMKLKRWAATLKTVAGVSPLHAREIASAIQTTLRGDPSKALRDEGALIALLVELLAELDERIWDAEAWSYLAGTKEKKKVLAYAPSP